MDESEATESSAAQVGKQTTIHGSLLGTTRPAASHGLSEIDKIGRRPAADESDDIPDIFVRQATLDFKGIQSLDAQPSGETSSSNVSTEDELEEVASRLESQRPISKSFSLDTSLDLVDPQDIFPLQIDGTLMVKFDGKPCQVLDGDQMVDHSYVFSNFAWFQEDNYKFIQDHCHVVIEGEKNQRRNNIYSITNHDIYMRHGSCRVVGTTAETKHNPELSTFTDTNMSQVAIRAICQFISEYPFQRFQLQLSCDYGSILVNPEAETTFQDAMRAHYHTKLRINENTLGKQDYISQADINQLTSENITNKLIDEDTELSDQEKVELKRLVHRQIAQTLLAVCVHARLSLKVFRHFLTDKSHQYSDERMPPSDKTSDCHEILCKTLWHNDLITNMHKFFVHTIEDDKWFHSRGSKEIIPISVVPDAEVHLGGYSKVYEVSIDPAHNSLASDSSRTYALKVFNKDPAHSSKREDHFRKEIRILLHLAVYPHPHILTHITSWTQDGIFYILYDKADYNLRTYMQVTPAGDFSRLSILWFLQQLRGIADAVRKVHQLREPPTKTFSPILSKKGSGELKQTQTKKLNSKETLELSAQLRKVASRERKKRKKKTNLVGYHHDIKPENILAFSRPNQLPLLKLSDFGAGKLFAVVGKHSGKPAVKATGTETYFGPEYEPAMRRKMTRPFDIWALGCVFLELLQWFVGMEGNVAGTGRSFAELRLDTPPDAQRLAYSCDYFWYKPAVPQHATKEEFLNPESILPCALNPWVEKLLDLLEDTYFQNMPAFLDLISIIRDLLEIDPRKRPNAPFVASRLDAILAQASVDLSERADIYSAHFKHNLKNISRNGQASENQPYPSRYNSMYSPLPDFPPQYSSGPPKSVDGSSVSATERRTLDSRLEDSTDSDSPQTAHLLEADKTGVFPTFEKPPTNYEMSDKKTTIRSRRSKSDLLDGIQPDDSLAPAPWTPLQIGSLQPPSLRTKSPMENSKDRSLADHPLSDKPTEKFLLRPIDFSRLQDRFGKRNSTMIIGTIVLIAAVVAALFWKKHLEFKEEGFLKQ